METTTQDQDPCASHDPADLVRARPGQYLSFELASSAYAVAILKVREIIEFTPTTHIPSMPDWILGVINLRGTVVPVVDLATRLGGTPSPITNRTCFVILDSEQGGESARFGIQVDAVTEVIQLTQETIEPAPAFGPRFPVEHLLGLAKKGDDFISLLDTDILFSQEEADVQSSTDNGEAQLAAGAVT